MHKLYFALMLLLSAAPAIAESGSAILPLLKSDENAFVRMLQQELSARSYYAGPLSGRLTQGTLDAIQHFCRDVGIREACADGPLSPGGAASIAAALHDPAVIPVPRTRPVQIAALSAPVPDDWSFYDVYDGLKSEVVGGGRTADGVQYWDVRLYGHSDQAGWSNITLAPGYPSRAGQVVTLSLYAGVVSAAANTNATLRLAMKRQDDLKYLGDALRGGYPLVQPEPREATFTVPALEGDALAIPYLQIRYGKGEDVDVTIRISPVKVDQS